MTLAGKARPSPEEIDQAMDISFTTGWNQAIDAAVGRFVAAPHSSFTSIPARNKILKGIMDLRHDKEHDNGQG